MKSSRILFLFALAGLCSTSLAAGPQKSGRFILDVKIDGTGQTQSGKSWTKLKTDETVHMAFTVSSDGVPSPINQLNMGDYNAAAVKQNEVDSEVQARNLPKQKEVAERAQKAIAACKGNITCMQRVSQEMSAQMASMTPTPAPVALSGDRYLMFFSQTAGVCNGEYTVRMQNSNEGATSDVPNLRPHLITQNADYKASGMEMYSVCGSQVVYDVKSNQIWVNAQMPEARGRYKQVENGQRVVQDDANAKLNLDAEAMKWVLKQLMGAPRSGKQKTTLRYPVTNMGYLKGENVVNVEMSWSFEGK